MANNKKSVLFTIDEDVYYQLRYKQKNMSAHVNQLIRNSVFSDSKSNFQKTIEEATFADLCWGAWYKAEPQSFESKVLWKMYEQFRTTSSNPDEEPSTP